MRRILSFHGFDFVLLLGIGFTTDCICAYTALDYLQQELIRENPSARQAQRNPTRHNKNPWKNKSVASGLSVIDFWTWRASLRRVSTTMWYCLPDSSPLLSLYPRLRPGLLSLRSVLSSRQIYLQPITNNQTPTTKHQQPIIIYFYLLIFYFSTK